MRRLHDRIDATNEVVNESEDRISALDEALDLIDLTHGLDRDKHSPHCRACKLLARRALAEPEEKGQ